MKRNAKKLLAFLLGFVFAMPICNMGIAGAYSDVITENCAAPAPLNESEWYCDSANIQVNADARSLTLGFEASYQAIKSCGEGDTYIVYKAPDGYKFSNCTAEGIFIGKSANLEFYAYTDDEMKQEYELSSKRSTAGAARVAWCYDKWSVTLLPEETKYLKIVLPAGENWGRHVNNIVLEAVPQAEKLYQSPYTDEFIGTIADDRYIAKSNNSYFGQREHGEGNIWGGGYLDRYLIFQCPPDCKVSTLAFTMYSALKGDAVGLSVCSTLNGEYINIPYDSVKKSLGQAWYEYKCTVDALPRNSKFIKVRMKDVGFDQNWIHYLDTITLSWVAEDEKISEMPRTVYGGLNLKRPERPKSDSDCFAFVDYLGDVVYMAPDGMKISSVTVKADSEPQMVAADVYENGIFKAAKLSNVGDGTYACAALPFNSQYIKFLGADVADVKMTFCDENDVISTSETVESKEAYNLFASDYLVEYNDVEAVSFSTTVAPFADYDGAVIPSKASDGANSYVIFSAPDSSVINDFTLYIRDELNVGIDVYASNTQSGGYNKIPVSNDKVAGYFRKICPTVGAVNAKYIKLVFGSCTDVDRSRNKLLGYSFNWSGTPEIGGQGDGYYSIDVNNGDARQEITGWGVFPYVGTKSAYADNEKLNKAVFNDLGENIIRFELYADYDLETASIVESSLETELELIDSAKKAGIEYMFTIWSPPVVMKSNKLISGYNSDLSSACLLEEHENDFADCIVKVLQYIKEKTGTLPCALSVQNEPEGPTAYQSCTYTDEQYNRVFNIVADAVEDAGFGEVMMMGSECSTFKKSVARWFGVQWENLPDALDAVVYHGYADNYTKKYDLNFERLNGRELWQTEFCDTDTTYSNSRYIANTLGSINQNTQFFRSNRWFYWSAYADTDVNDFQGLIYKTSDGNYNVNSKYKLLNRIYQNVKPGSYVVSLSTTDKRLFHELDLDRARSDLGAFRTSDGNVVTLVNSSSVRNTYSVTGLEGNSATVYKYVGNVADETSEFVKVSDGRIDDIVLKSGESAIIVTGNNRYMDYFVNRFEGTVNIKIDSEFIKKYQNPVLISTTRHDNKLTSVSEYDLKDLENIVLDIGLPENDDEKLELFVWDMSHLYPIFEHLEI